MVPVSKSRLHESNRARRADTPRVVIGAYLEVPPDVLARVRAAVRRRGRDAAMATLGGALCTTISNHDTISVVVRNIGQMLVA